jgi:lysophospholipase L1-like esterase
VNRFLTFGRAAAARLLTILASLFVALLISEIAVRWLAPQPLIPVMEDEWSGLQTLRPNVTGRHRVPHLFDEQYSTDARGLRRMQSIDTAAWRILCLGDSFTFGVGASEGNTYPQWLQRNLMADRAEVINAGVPGTGTGEQVLLYKYRLASLHPRIIVLGYHNDLQDDAARQLFQRAPDGTIKPRPLAEIAAAGQRIRRLRALVNAIPGYRFICERSQLVNLVRRAVSTSLKKRRMPRMREAPFQRISDDAAATLRAELVMLARDVRANGGTLLVAYFPDRTQVVGPFDRDAVTNDGERNELRSLCQHEELPFVDTTPALRAAKSAGPSLYYDGLDKHPTPAGYRTIAGEVAVAIRRIER